MLYQQFDMYQRSLQLWHPFFDLSREIITDNVSRYTDSLTGKSLKAFLEMGVDLTKPYGKPEFGIKKIVIDKEKYHVTEDIVLEKPFCNLLRFHHTDEGTRPRVLLIAALSGHHATLCKSTIETLLPEHELYVTDWIDAKHVPLSDGKFGFEDYISYLIEFLEFLGPNTHVIAVCQPTVQALMATAVMAENKNPATPTSLTLMAGPVDTRVNANSVYEFANQFPLSWYKEALIYSVPLGYGGAGRKVYPGFLQLWCFMAMNASSHMGRFSDFYMHLLRGDDESVDRHRDFYDEYFAVLDLTEEFYMETMERVFREHDLAEGTATYQGELVNLDAITNTALFTVEGEDDDICAVGQTEAAQGMCKNIPATMRKHLVQPGVGHYGVFSGSKFRDQISPKIATFIRKFDMSREELSFKKVVG